MKLGLVLALLFLVSCGREEKEIPDLINKRDASALVPTTEKIVAKGGTIETARKKALDSIERAGRKAATPQEAQLFQSLHRALSGAKIQVPPPGQDLKTCVEEANVLAFVNLMAPNIINICARASGADTKHLSQVLIHETAHVAGIHDECDATKVEVEVMRRTGEGLAFRNGYMNRCKIR